MTAAPAPGLLADRRFRRFWIGQTVSVFGDQVTLLAIPLTAVVTLGVGATEMGLLTAAGYAPHLLLSLVAGDWIDRSARRRALMVAADLGRALVLLSLPIAYALGALSSAIGLRPTLWIAAVGGLLSVIWLWRSPIPRLAQPPVQAE